MLPEELGPSNTTATVISPTVYAAGYSLLSMLCVRSNTPNCQKIQHTTCCVYSTVCNFTQNKIRLLLVYTDSISKQLWLSSPWQVHHDGPGDRLHALGNHRLSHLEEPSNISSSLQSCVVFLCCVLTCLVDALHDVLHHTPQSHEHCHMYRSCTCLANADMVELCLTPTKSTVCVRKRKPVLCTRHG